MARELPRPALASGSSRAIKLEKAKPAPRSFPRTTEAFNRRKGWGIGSYVVCDSKGDVQGFQLRCQRRPDLGLQRMMGFGLLTAVRKSHFRRKKKKKRGKHSRPCCSFYFLLTHYSLRKHLPLPLPLPKASPATPDVFLVRLLHLKGAQLHHLTPISKLGPVLRLLPGVAKCSEPVHPGPGCHLHPQRSKDHWTQKTSPWHGPGAAPRMSPQPGAWPGAPGASNLERRGY